MSETLDKILAAHLQHPKRPKPTDGGPSDVFKAARHRGPECLAPVLDDERLAAYEQRAAAAPPAVREAMTGLIAMLRKFRETPDSTLPGEPLDTSYTRNPFRHPETGEPVDPPRRVPLEAAEIDRIWDDVPWEHEIRAMDDLFAAIDNTTHKPLRDAAFHLLWFARELRLDREPLTQDKLGK